MLIVEVKDRRAILRTAIAELPVGRQRVDVVPEDVEQRRLNNVLYEKINAREPKAGVDWRESRRALSERTRGAIEALGIIFPQAIMSGKEREEYKRFVASVGDITPDARERTDILVATYKAIEPPKDKWGNDDFKAMLREREAMLAELKPAERQAVEAKLQEKLTDVERKYVEEAIPKWLRYQELLRADVSRAMGRSKPWTEKQWNYLRSVEEKYEATRDPAQKQAILDGMGKHAGTYQLFEQALRDVTTDPTAYKSQVFRRDNPIMRNFGLVR